MQQSMRITEHERRTEIIMNYYRKKGDRSHTRSVTVAVITTTVQDVLLDVPARENTPGFITDVQTFGIRGGHQDNSASSHARTVRNGRKGNLRKRETGTKVTENVSERENGYNS